MLRCCASSLLAGFLVCCVPNERPEAKREPASSTVASATTERVKRARPDKKARLERRRPDAAARRVAADSGSRSTEAGSPSPVRTVSTSVGSTGSDAAELFYDFERGPLEADWNLTSPAWKLEQGRLCVQGARNRPAWLKTKIPTNARIEFEATSSSPDGDIKVEVWGDGKSAAVTTSYTNASSYVVIFGGWKNSYHVLARIDEHAKNRPEVRIDPNGDDLRAQPVVPDHTYHFKIERNDGKTVRWFVDDIEIISFSDPAPLAGEGHEHLGFNNWETRVCFDNLRIVPL